MFGLPTNTSYATAKGGVVGLTRSLPTAGAAHGIKVNLIAPGAMTRMAGPGSEDPRMAPELVAPMAAFLAHESCPVSGEIYTAGFGRFARLFIASTEGYVHVGQAPTMEDVAAHWGTINDETGYSYRETSWTGPPPSWPISGRTVHPPGLRGPTDLLVEQIGILLDNPVVEGLELPPPVRCPPVWPAVVSATSGSIRTGVPAASATSCAWHVRSIVTNHHAASSTVRPTVSRP